MAVITKASFLVVPVVGSRESDAVRVVAIIVTVNVRIQDVSN